MSEVLVTPEILRWARARLNASLERMAKKVPVKPEKLKAWEQGLSKPTFPQAKRLAKILHIPLGYLFLSSPPEEKLSLPDLRTVLDQDPGELSVDFRELLNDTLRKQQWYREFLQEEQVEKLGFIGKFKISNNESQISEDIRKALDINDNFRNQSSSWEEFLSNLIQRVESLRILVLRSGIVKNDTHRKLSVSEFRGFVICDDIAPLIFLNGRDAKAAQIFTLAHELVHLWVGESGISNPDLGKQSITINQEIERFCNRVAADVLVPYKSFVESWKDSNSISDNLLGLVRRYRVSSLVILRRAFDLEKMTWEQYKEHYKNERKKQKDKEHKQQKKGGGDFYATLGVRNSQRLTRTILSAVLEGRMLYRDASRLLGLRVEKIERAAREFGIR